FPVESTEASMYSEDIGYLRLHQLHHGTPAQARKELEVLVATGANSFILDLRDCAGGDLEAARAVADLFLGEDTVVAHVDEPGLGTEDLLTEQPARFTETLAVLINGWTLGSAEIVAAALKEHDRGFLIGEPTMGKSTTETLVNLGHTVVLRLESVRVSGPMGKSWEGKGVSPDQPIWSTARQRSVVPGSEGDLQLQTAVHYLETDALPKKKP
ncbi:MAG: S41 family peptidase, partial [Myxococcota bacterium]|nr:S41 family peptidase [Myxococcota bacterium]